jgi:hypothetical protein
MVKTMLVLFLMLMGKEVCTQSSVWVKANPQIVFPSKFTKHHTRCWFGGTTYRANTGTILFYDGIEDGVNRGYSIYANSLWGWDLKTNRVELIKADNYGIARYEIWPLPELDTDTTPNPRHTYEGFVYADALDALFMSLGAYTQYELNSPRAAPYFSGDRITTWQFNFSSTRWKKIPRSIKQLPGGAGIDKVETHMQYWKSRNKILFADHHGSFHAVMDLDYQGTGIPVWLPFETANNSPFSLYEGLSCWDPKRDRMVFRKNGNVCYLDANTRTYHSLPDCGLNGTAIAYIPGWDVYLAVGTSASQTKIFDITGNRWESLSAGSTNFDMGNHNDYYIEYDATTGKVGMVTAGGTFYTLYLPKGVVSVQQDDRAYGEGISVSPNPFTNGSFLNIECRISNVECRSADLSIFDIKGKLVKKLSFEIRSSELDIHHSVKWNASGHPSGIYFLKATIGSKTYSKKLFLQK